jgi:hypothetical protein
MAEPFYFICYSRRDADNIALALADSAFAGPRTYPSGLTVANLQPSIDWDEQIASALRECAGVLYLMTGDSVSPNSECRENGPGARHNNPLFHSCSTRMPRCLFGSNRAVHRLHARIRCWPSSPAGTCSLARDTGRYNAYAERAARGRPSRAGSQRGIGQGANREEMAELERQVNEQQRRIGKQ